MYPFFAILMLIVMNVRPYLLHPVFFGALQYFLVTFWQIISRCERLRKLLATEV